MARRPMRLRRPRRTPPARTVTGEGSIPSPRHMPKGSNPRSRANLTPRTPAYDLPAIVAHVRAVADALGHTPTFAEWKATPHPQGMTYANIARRFPGGFRGAIIAAGLTPRARGDYDRTTVRGNPRRDRRMPNRQMVTGGS